MSKFNFGMVLGKFGEEIVLIEMVMLGDELWQVKLFFINDSTFGSVFVYKVKLNVWIKSINIIDENL